MVKDRKKILYVITKGNFGGAQRYVYDLASNLPKNKFEVVVACGIKEGRSLVYKLIEKNIRTLELHASEREVNLKNDFKTLVELIKIISTEKPDVVHLNSSKIGLLGSFALLYLKLLSIIHNSKFIINSVFTSHGWAFYESHRSLLQKMIYYFSHWVTILLCDKTIAVSEKTRSDMAWLPFMKNKMIVIHNGLDHFKIMTKKDSSLILKKENGQLSIFSLAELHKNKGIDIALRGISLLPKEIRDKIQYYIAGDGEEKDTLYKMGADLGLEKTVHFLGFIENGRGLLSGADIFLFTSRTENLPFAILEAGACGVATIATSVGGIPEIIKDMQNGILIHPKNPKEIAEAITYLLDHKEKRKEFGEEIKKTVTNFFTLEKMLSETTRVYLDSGL